MDLSIRVEVNKRLLFLALCIAKRVNGSIVFTFADTKVN